MKPFTKRNVFSIEICYNKVMRFKHTKTILLIITNLLLLSLLYIGYQKIQRVREQKAYQDQFAKGHPTREKL